MTPLLQIGRAPTLGGPPVRPASLRPDAELRLVRSRLGTHLFVADGSRIYDVPPATAARLEAWLAAQTTPDAPAGQALWKLVGLFPEQGRTRRRIAAGDEAVPLAG